MSKNPVQRPERHPLRGHHAKLFRLFGDLMAEIKKDDRSKLHQMWDTFENALLAHMVAEETELLPAYARVSPDEADGIARDHHFFRTTLAEFGVDLELHLMRSTAVEAFLGRLRAHASIEDKSLYPWAKASLPAAVLNRFRLAAAAPPPSKVAAVVGRHSR
jgi:hemerythrin-like domain-containing protein